MNIIKSSLNIILPIFITILVTLIIETVIYFNKINNNLSIQLKKIIDTLDTIKLSLPTELKNIEIFNKLSPKTQSFIVNELKRVMTDTLRQSTDSYDKQLEDNRNQIMIAYLILLFTFGVLIVVLLIFFRNYIDWFKMIVYLVVMVILLVGTQVFFVKLVYPNLAIINGYDALFSIISSIITYLQK